MGRSETITLTTRGRSTRDITSEIDRVVRGAAVSVGLAHVFLHHTSASLIVCENADPSVRRDLEAWLSKLVQDGDPLFTHRAEGDDDMSGHIRSVLTACELSLPVRDGHLYLGTWQGLFLYEHRHQPHQRQITVTVIG